ncbi:hypothetical protein [Cysteiniphilum litorale]|uniref:hypothetical protein n=1 Tax=Cysteiniphilum litorale TaxID=2056700 RepID=UPI003F883C8E
MFKLASKTKLSFKAELGFVIYMQLWNLFVILSSGQVNYQIKYILVFLYSFLCIAPTILLWIFIWKRESIVFAECYVMVILWALVNVFIPAIIIIYMMFVSAGFFAFGLTLGVILVALVLMMLMCIGSVKNVLDSYMDAKAIDNVSSRFTYVWQPQSCVLGGGKLLNIIFQVSRYSVLVYLGYVGYVLYSIGGKRGFHQLSWDNPHEAFVLAIIPSGIMVLFFIWSGLMFFTRIYSLIAILQWQKQNPDKPKLTLGWKRMSKE